MSATLRRRSRLPTPSYGWVEPWPNVFELVEALDCSKWSLVGGLMVQAHALAHSVPAPRPTVDLDILLHIEVDTEVASDADRAIRGLGYERQDPHRPRGAVYRYRREHDVIDVMVADHAAPRARQELQGHPMFAVDGGTQALKRTMIYLVLPAVGRELLEFSIPDELGALVLKAAAYQADSRDRDRHLADAAVLAVCINDPVAERSRLVGSDRSRILRLAQTLHTHHSAWLNVGDQATAGLDTLRILSSAPMQRKPPPSRT